MAINRITEVLADFAAGKMVILIDEEARENEGDLMIAADFVTAEHINFMAKHGRGLICLTLTEGHCRQLNLPLMVTTNRSSHGTNFTVSIEAATGVTTGISAADRARTIQVAVRNDAKPSDIVQPGHIFPLMAQPGGVLVRAGHTEAGCDLAQLAGLTSAAVICEILKDDGEMARLDDLLSFAQAHKLKIGTIADLIHYRSETEKLIERKAERSVKTPFGEFLLIGYADKITHETHLALVKGEIVKDRETLVRVHEPISVLDFLDQENAGHSWSVYDAMRTIDQSGSGVIVLLGGHETSRQLLSNLADNLETIARLSSTELRNYGIGAQILNDLNVGKMRLLAKPRNMPNMAGFGLEVTGYLNSPLSERDKIKEKIK